MLDQSRICQMAGLIVKIKCEMDKLRELGSGINCVEKNIERMSACLKMLELNVNDAADILFGEGGEEVA